MKRIFSILVVGLLSLLMAGTCFGCTSTGGGSSSSSSASSGEGNSWGNYVDTAWLKAHQDEVCIVDVRSSADYATQHIPGAVNLYWTSLADVSVKQGEAGWASLLPSDSLAGLLSGMGIPKDKAIVLYGEPNDAFGEDGRIMWALNEAGYSDVHILDGGWTQWLFDLGEHESVMAAEPVGDIEQVDTDYVKSASNAVLLDVRGAKEYSGEMDMGEARPGHIPGAVSLPMMSFFNEDGTIMSDDEITKIVEDAGVKQSDEIITYCTGGVRAANAAEILKMCGFDNVKVYTVGYSEWAGNPENPIEL